MTTIDSGTTDSNGRVKLCYPSAGHYLISVSGSGHNDFSDRDYLLNCGAPCSHRRLFSDVRLCGELQRQRAGVRRHDHIKFGRFGGNSANGCALVPVPSAGTYTFTATWGGQTASQTETVTGNGICSYLEVAFAIWRCRLMAALETNSQDLPSRACGATVTINGTRRRPTSTEYHGCSAGCGSIYPATSTTRSQYRQRTSRRSQEVSMSRVAMLRTRTLSTHATSGSAVLGWSRRLGMPVGARQIYSQRTECLAATLLFRIRSRWVTRFTGRSR